MSLVFWGCRVYWIYGLRFEDVLGVIRVWWGSGCTVGFEETRPYMHLRSMHIGELPLDSLYVSEVMI